MSSITNVKLFLLFLMLLSFVSCEDSHKHTCRLDSDCVRRYKCMDLHCVHKGVNPISVEDIIIFVVVGAMSLIASSSGIGGGAVYSVILMFVDNYPAQHAFPLSNFIIFICSSATFTMGVIDKVNNPDKLWVNYDIVLLCCPIMLIGSKIGVILNKIFPSMFLNLMLIAILTLNCIKTWGNAKKQKEKEDQLTENDDNEKILDEDGEQEFYGNILKTNVLNIISPHNGLVSPKPGLVNPNPGIRRHYAAEYFKKTPLIEEPVGEKITPAIRFDRIKYLFLLILITIVDQIIEGSSKFESILGITKCTIPYWLLFVLFASFCFYIINYFKTVIQADLEKATDSEREIIDSIFDNKTLTLIFCAGIFGGMLGLGGGIIISPMLIDMGIDAQIVSASSNCILVFTSCITTILYTFSGQLLYYKAAFLGVIGMVSTFIGVHAITNYIRRTKKSSVLIMCVFVIMLLSLIILPFNGFYNAYYDIIDGKNIFEFKNYCS